MVDDIAVLADRNGWTVDDDVATYAPEPGGWLARVRKVRVAGHSYERWHIAVIDPHRCARYTCFASSVGEAARVAEHRIRATSAQR